MKTIISALTALLCIVSGMNITKENSNVNIEFRPDSNPATVCETSATEINQNSSASAIKTESAQSSSGEVAVSESSTSMIENADSFKDSEISSEPVNYTEQTTTKISESPSAAFNEEISNETHKEISNETDDKKDTESDSLGVLGNAFFGSTYPVRENTVIRDGRYLKVNFLKDKAYQNQINSDIKALFDEKYTDEDREIQVYILAKNGYLFLTFYCKSRDVNELGWYNISTLTYDIIEHKQLTSAEELFTNTAGMYDAINEFAANNEAEGEYKGEVTADNIIGFDWQALYFENDNFLHWNLITLIDCDGNSNSDIAKFCKTNYLREMDDCIDEEFSGFYNVSIFN